MAPLRVTSAQYFKGSCATKNDNGDGEGLSGEPGDPALLNQGVDLEELLQALRGNELALQKGACYYQI